jgi:hypothetical protein
VIVGCPGYKRTATIQGIRSSIPTYYEEIKPCMKYRG